jgi:CheY-like chemotaxis protein
MRSARCTSRNAIRSSVSHFARARVIERCGVAPQTTSPLVLVVDDVADNRAICCDYLESTGYRTESAATGPDALKKARSMMPDVILLDLALPLLNGLDVAKQLRTDARTRDIQIIILTAHDHLRRDSEGLCEAYLTKPCAPEEIERHVREIIQLRSPR